MKFKPPKNKQLLQSVSSPVKKNIARWQWYSVVTIVVAPLIYIVWLIFSSNYFIVADGSVVTKKYLIRAHEDAFVKTANIFAGDIVNKQDLAFKMSSPLLETELEEVNSQISELKRLQEKLYKTDLQALENKYKIAQKYANINKKFYHAMVDLRKQNIINIIELQQSSQVLHNAEMDLENVLVERQKYSLDKDNDYAKALRDLNLQRKILEEKINSLDIKTDVNAIVNRVYVYKGEFVQKGQELAMLSLFDEPYIRAYLESKYISYVHQGSHVDIRFEDGTTFKGKIISKPIFAEINKDDASVFGDAKSEVVIIVKPLEKIPDEYNINNVPVKIDIDRI